MKLKIELQGTAITLRQFDHLESHHQNNFQFMGFSLDQSGVCYNAKSPSETLLNEIVQYLDVEGISYLPSPQVRKQIKLNQDKLSQFESARHNALELKDGKVDKNRFNEILPFLKNIPRRLKDHQIKSALHFYTLGNAANFSVPGSGKTSVVLSIYEKLKQEKKINTIFVVGPLSCFSPWRREFELTLGRVPEFKILAGGNQVSRKQGYFLNPKCEIYFSSFQTLLFDKNEVKALLSQKNVKALLVIDEAHYIKKINGEWASVLLELGRYAINRVVLTGTPFPRSYVDVFNMFDFLWPNHQAISNESKSQIKIYEKLGQEKSARKVLRQEIGPLFYRVRKKDLELSPQNFIKPKLVTMNTYERRIYDALYSRIREYPKVEFVRNISLIEKFLKARIIRLRQAVSYTKLLSGNNRNDRYTDFQKDSDLYDIIRNYDSIEVPAKITALLHEVVLLKRDRQKVVIWSNFIGTIHLIVKHLSENGISCKEIHGSTPIEVEGSTSDEETREKIRDEFLDPQSGLDILVANPAACSESISLHKTCFHAIYYDLSYNCAQYLQSLDRIHRVGGSEEHIANYHYLQYSKTIDGDIKANLETKKKRMLDIIDEDYGIYSMDMSEGDDDVEAYMRLFIKSKS